jgi:uroporphyrinogen decarboxylase
MIEAYTSLQRVTAALEHREADRVPFDLGGTAVTSINMNALRKLRAHLRLPGEPELRDIVTQIGWVDDELVERFGIDVMSVPPGEPGKPGHSKRLGVEGGYDRLIDEFGIGWRMPVNGGNYYDLYHSPLASAETVRDVGNYQWPDPLDAQRFTGIEAKARRITEQMGKAFVCERMSSGMWEHAMWLRGYEQFFTDMLTDKPMVIAIMEKILEIKMAYWGRYLDIVGNKALVMSCADDLGSTRGLLVSLELYKELIWPYHKRLYEFVKKRAKSRLYVFFHCDGAIYEALPLLIEAGVDIVNPWQVSCAGMDDTRKFKKEFGTDLTLWGGTCDAAILEFGTPDQVAEETRRRMDDLAPGGGFIAASIHVIQGGVPAENIMAWRETIDRYGTY